MLRTQMHQMRFPPSVSSSEDVEAAKSEAEACVGFKEQALGEPLGLSCH